jgi:hypothetical protein
MVLFPCAIHTIITLDVQFMQMSQVTPEAYGALPFCKKVLASLLPCLHIHFSHF